MNLIVLGSSSQGNCYLLKADSGEVLVVEAGVKFSEVKKSLDYKISNICAIVTTHRHGDHSAYISDFCKNGIMVLALQDVLQSKGIADKPFTKAIVPDKGYIVGGFRILTFPLVHDVPSVGFIIEHPEMGKAVFITDTMMMAYRLPNDINHYLIECNYSDKILEENILNGVVASPRANRTRTSHMEIETAKGILTTNDLSNTQNIILIHLSEQNSDAEIFRKELNDITHKQVYVARKGLNIELNKTPY